MYNIIQNAGFVKEKDLSKLFGNTAGGKGFYFAARRCLFMPELQNQSMWEPPLMSISSPVM